MQDKQQEMLGKKGIPQVKEDVPIIPQGYPFIHSTALDNKEYLLYDQVAQIDFDIDFDFDLRSGGYNEMINISNPLLLLGLRLNKIEEIKHVKTLYERVQNEITAISEELKTHHYDSAVQLSFRYCLCTYIDEMVMATPWGKHSVWAERSMLALFHNETWGGEKFYSILSRLMLEPDKYQDLLEFMYLCLALGYKGHYKTQTDGNEHIQDLLTKLHALLRAQRGEIQKNQFQSSISKRDYTFKHAVPFWKILLGVGVALTVVYLFYTHFLSTTTQGVLHSIDHILE